MGVRNCEATSFYKEEHIEQFLKEDRIFHVYGSVRADPFDRSGYGTFPVHTGDPERAPLEIYIDRMDRAWNAAKNIRLMGEERSNNSSTVDLAAQKISEAKSAFILGYGFDEENNRVLRLEDSLKWNQRGPERVYFTNYADNRRLNKRVGTMFLEKEQAFVRDSICSSQLAKQSNVEYPYFEKSTENVYDALKNDFDLC